MGIWTPTGRVSAGLSQSYKLEKVLSVGDMGALEELVLPIHSTRPERGEILPTVARRPRRNSDYVESDVEASQDSP